jgi:hypothetical protein
MVRKIFDVDAFLEDLNKRFEKEELIYDFKVFINYVVNNKIKLTPKNAWIPAKYIYAINSLFRNPAQLDEKIGNKVYKLREEPSYSRFYFLDLLAGASGCIEVDEKDVLVKGKNYDRFMKMGGMDKKRWLILSWWFNMDWENWMPQGDFGKLMQEKKLLLADHLQSWLDKRGRVDFKKSSRKLREVLNLRWEAPSQDYAPKLINWGIERCLLIPLLYFDIIELVCKKGKYNIEETVGFYIKPVGRIFLEEIIRVIKKSQAKYN